MDVRPLVDLDAVARSNAAVGALFRLRGLLGRVFGWEAARESDGSEPDARSFVHRLTALDRQTSLVPPGSSDGPFTVLYVRDDEAVNEIRNSTVHAFSVLALVPRTGGYRLFWAIHVTPVGRITAGYMALIDPFRRYLIYPSVLRYVHRGWCAQFAESAR
jgi:hypothetical protein